MSEPTALTVRAQFNPLIRLYLLLTIGLQLAASLIGLPLAVIWFCGAGQWWARHYFDRLSCELTPEHLRFRKGIIFTVEKTIPLENIQDVTFIEGPLLRHFHLPTLKLETAGQSVGQAHDMHLTGIIDAMAFRERILAGRKAARAAAVEPTDERVLLAQVVARLDRIAALLDRSRDDAERDQAHAHDRDGPDGRS
jgi:membrane protein YdbS with pleckstrin-like domain